VDTWHIMYKRSMAHSCDPTAPTLCRIEPPLARDRTSNVDRPPSNVADVYSRNRGAQRHIQPRMRIPKKSRPEFNQLATCWNPSTDDSKDISVKR
jgi:hypothetical protein